MHEQLSKLYFAPPRPEAYTGANKIIDSVRKKYSIRKVIDWLEGQDAYNLHRPVRHKFPRRHYNVRNCDDVWEADLIDMRAFRTYNDNHSYVLVVIDVLSKNAWVLRLVDKTSKSIARTFENILRNSGNRKPVILQTDKGKEFVGRELQEVLKRDGIQFRIVRSPDVKMAIAERFIRTIKERLWRYFTHKNTRRNVDILQDVVNSYNHSKHSSIKMEPASVTIHNAHEARENLETRYGRVKYRKPKYSVDDLVRVSRARNVFAKGYEGGWTLELFKITRISEARQPPVYYLRDLADEDIEGYFYEHELSRVRKDLNDSRFEVEKILKSAGRSRKKKYLVKWKGYPDKFNSWITADQIKKIA